MQTPSPGNGIDAIAVTYTLEFVASDNGLKVGPERFNRIYQNDVMIINSDEAQLAGNYTLNLVGTFFYQGGASSTSLRVPFNVTLIPPPATFAPLPQHEYFGVEDHSMDWPEGWSYQIGGPSPIYGKYGDELIIWVDLGAAMQFVSWNKTSRTVSIDEGSLTEADAGEYEIFVFARYSNDTYQENYKTSFTLVVRNDNPTPKPKEWQPSTKLGDWKRLNGNSVRQDF